jgi:hypothetical protein
MHQWKRFPWWRLVTAFVVAAALLLLTNVGTSAKDMFIGIEGGSDAVLLDSERRWARSLGPLQLDQRVTVLDPAQLADSSRTLIRVRTEIDGEAVEGWVRRVALSEGISEAGTRGSEAEGVRAAGLAGKGLNEEIEGELEENDPRFAAALEQVTAMEHVRNIELGGDAEQPNPSRVRAAYERFGRDGKLID